MEQELLGSFRRRFALPVEESFINIWWKLISHRLALSLIRFVCDIGWVWNPRLGFINHPTPRVPRSTRNDQTNVMSTWSLLEYSNSIAAKGFGWSLTGQTTWYQYLDCGCHPSPPNQSTHFSIVYAFRFCFSVLISGEFINFRSDWLARDPFWNRSVPFHSIPSGAGRAFSTSLAVPAHKHSLILAAPLVVFCY